MQKLTKAFKELKKLGYFAERNLACCQSCAIEEIPEDNASLYVFTTEQDEQILKNTGSCFISWQAPEDNPIEIIGAFGRVDLFVSHSGSIKDRIQIAEIKR